MKPITTILVALFLTLAIPALAQTKEVVYIRIQEVIFFSAAGYGIAPDSYMRIVYPDKESRQIELPQIGKNGSKSLQNGQKIQQELTTLLNEGYEITSSSVGGDIMMSTTIMILTRQKNK